MSGAIGITLQKVSVTRGGKAILEGLDLQVQAGQVLALLGPNGAGKSTALRVALGLLPADRGTALLGGRDVRMLSGAERARLAGYVPQRSQLQSDLCVRVVVGQGRYAWQRGAWAGPSAEDEAAVDAALASCDVAHLAQRSFLSLSGGEAQRVLVARAVAGGAPCLLLDEPTAHLDLRHALEMSALLRRLATAASAPKAVLVVLHDLHVARHLADTVQVLHQGRSVALGPANTVPDTATLAQVYGVAESPSGGYRLYRELAS